MDTWIACGTILGVYLIVSAIVSLWSTAVVAPVNIHNQQGKTIHELSEKLEFPDKALAEHLRELLECVGDNGKKVIRFLLWHGESTLERVRIPEMTEKEVHEALELCFSQNLLKTRLEGRTATSHAKSTLLDLLGGNVFYFVPDELANTLKRLLAD